jgi:hypothetical protein
MMSPELKEGDRVRAVHFAIDDGLRVWPVMHDGRPTGEWRVVYAVGSGPDFKLTERARGTQQECLASHPSATYGINDNETVPPGTLGTVSHVSELQTFVAWDNGARLAFGPHDIYERLPVAVVMMVMATIAMPEQTIGDVVRQLRAAATESAERAAIIDALGEAGWTMQQPFVMSDGSGSPSVADGHNDIVVYLRKAFETSAQAEAEVGDLGCTERLNFSFGWNDNGTATGTEHPSCEWWGECP